MRETSQEPPVVADKAIRGQLVGLINQLLVDAIDLHMQAKRTRWQLTDQKLAAFRPICDQVAEEVDEEIQELVNWASHLVEDFPEIVLGKDLPPRVSNYPAIVRTQADHLRALAHSLKVFMKTCIDDAVAAKNLGDRKSGTTFAHIARIPSRLAKELVGKLELMKSNADFEQTSLSIWIGEGGSYDHSGKSPTLSD
jgi:DNA-binding ferritin-like protein